MWGDDHAAHSVCSLPRLRGRGGEGAHKLRSSFVACPLPIPPPADAAREVGFREVTSADGDKDDLATLLRARAGEHPLLYLAGEDRAGDAADWGVPAVSVVAYRAVKLERFAPPVAATLSQRAFDGVLHFSRRSAEAYLDCTARARMRVRALVPVHFCLSVQVSHPLLAVGAPKIRIAPRPDEAALLELVGDA